ncbi:adenylate/guanylate cyclase domain-containing protein [Nordella sp. HKS 07]|uniref:adenylate/guanylate cyclase domain-containing protein n=1 Tax=Nordella sp. HKS 07 TaxID=2712222 RepID=UPI0013E1D175|nr:adenylate/guanylate cyclase domain-containing protein [Nordella sp. HKS 07]QIG51003.1 adenylate/guanylate cyclase domain-containing protein [Nordella sp. HKS 07]
MAAILAADVAGYSMLMGKDEEGTLATLRVYREAIDALIAQHEGRVFGSAGDSVIAEFASPVEAVRCATKIQIEVDKRNASLPEPNRMRFRIGINLGDIVVDGGNLMGDGVNVAARLQGLAEPDGICISSKVFEEVRGKNASVFEDMGEQTVKNIEHPVRVYRWQREDLRGVPAARRLTLNLPDRPSIAVLPFQNMSGDPEQEYFADGMVEEIITALSRMRWLFVIARNSSFVYKGRAVDVKQIGRELGVRYVLEGSVRKAGNKVRITGQLIDSTTGAHLWADRFDGTVEDVFDLQDQVTQNVVAAIAPKLEQPEIERSRRKPTGSLDAYDYYLRGLSALHQWTKVACAEALVHFHRAIELDPGFASAYGMAARCYSMRKVCGWVEDAAKEAVEADRLARRASELGKDDAVALAAAGIALGFVVEDLDRARELVDRATALDPNMAWAWLWSAWIRAWLGEPETAKEYAARALRLSPLDSHRASMFAAMAAGHFLAGSHDEALAWAERAQLEMKGVLFSMALMAASAALAGKLDRAKDALDQIISYHPHFSISMQRQVFPFRRPQDIAKLAEGLRKAGLPE